MICRCRGDDWEKGSDNAGNAQVAEAAVGDGDGQVRPEGAEDCQRQGESQADSATEVERERDRACLLDSVSQLEEDDRVVFFFITCLSF